MHTCTICRKVYSSRKILKRHTYTHLPKTVPCSMCTERFGHRVLLKRHIRKVHGERKYMCDVKGCQSNAFATSYHLERHKWKRHNIQSTMNSLQLYRCEHCTYITKDESHLRRHQSSKHDIGDNPCALCFRNCYYIYNVEVNGESIRACSSCVRRANNATRKETKMIERIKRDDLISPYIALQDQVLKHQNCSTRRRPDLLLSMPCHLHIIVECDEYQHSRYESKCENGRMNELIDEFKEGKVIFVRYNPDSYTDRTGKRVPYLKSQESSRLDMLIKLIHFIIQNVHDMSAIFVYYMYYSFNSEIISTSLPCKLVYDENDFRVNPNRHKRKRSETKHIGKNSKRVKLSL